jgi:hypothetical protein
MRRTALMAASLLGVVGLATMAEAQEVHTRGPLRLEVRPRSWLDAGNVVSPYSSVNPASAYGQTVSYLANPPYSHSRDRFRQDPLPDPITNGPFPGSRSVLEPIDFGAGLDD